MKNYTLNSKEIDLDNGKRHNKSYKRPLNWTIPAAIFLGGIGSGIVFPILPILGLQFDLAPVFIGLILAANRITRLFFNQPVGAIIDKFGYKNPLIFGLFVESVGSLSYVYALSSQYHGLMLLIGRIIWGIGSAFVFIAANTIALNASVHSTRGRSTAKIRVALSFGMPAGFIAGGISASLFGNATAFLFSTSLSASAALFVFIFFKDIKVVAKKETNLLKSLTYAFKHKNLFMICLFNFIVSFSLRGVVLTTLVLFVEYKKFVFLYSDPRFSAGILMTFMMLSSGISALLIGKIIDSIKLRSVAALLFILIVIFGFILLAFSYNSYIMLLALILLGSGIGVNNVVLLSIFGDMTPKYIRGRSVSVYQFMGDLGGSIGPIFGIQVGMLLNFSTVYIITALIFTMSIPIIIYIYNNEKTLLNS